MLVCEVGEKERGLLVGEVDVVFLFELLWLFEGLGKVVGFFWLMVFLGLLFELFLEELFELFGWMSIW